MAIVYTRRFEKDRDTNIGNREDNDDCNLNEIQRDIRANPILTYCNYSFAKKFHIDSKKLKHILKNFNIDYCSFYIRLINEIPARQLKIFATKYNIDYEDIKYMYSQIDYFEKYINHLYLEEYKNAKV